MEGKVKRKMDWRKDGSGRKLAGKKEVRIEKWAKKFLMEKEKKIEIESEKERY